MPSRYLKILYGLQNLHQKICLSCVIEKSWLMQESPPLKPDRYDDIKLFSLRYSYTSPHIKHSNILSRIGNSEAGL